MQVVSISASLAMLSLVSLCLFPQSSFADGDWHSGHFYEKLKGAGAPHQGLYGGEFTRVYDSYYYPERGFDRRDRLYGGRHYYRDDYRRGFYRNGGGHRPWSGRGYGRGGWNCPPRYGYGRGDYYRGGYSGRNRSPW